MNRNLLVAAAMLDAGRLYAFSAGVPPDDADARFLEDVLAAPEAAALLRESRGARESAVSKILARAEEISGGAAGNIEGLLRSPFAGLDLGLGRVAAVASPLLPMTYSLEGKPLTERTEPLEFYLPDRYRPQSVFPLPQSAESADRKELADSFVSECRVAAAAPGSEDVATLLNRLLALILRYGWYLPAGSDRVVSIYDKAKVAVALAASLETAGGAGASGGPELLLVGGDISGIQSYLFDISDPGNREVARRLRARSFFLSKLTDVFLHRLLTELSLPEPCALFNSGGRFLLVLPGTDAARDFLTKKETELNLYLLHHMLGDISFQVGRIEISGDELKPGAFRVTLERLGAAVEARKARRFSAVLEKENGWAVENFRLTNELFLRYQNGVCTLCHKLPSVTETGECENCAQDAEAGRKLTMMAGYTIRPSEGDMKYLTGDARTAIEFHRSRLEAIRILNPDESETIAETNGFLFMNNHVPSVTADTLASWRCSRHSAPENCPTIQFQRAYPDLGEWPVAIECLAGLGASRTDLPAETKVPDGSPYIGVLKADVDRLGMLFSLGMRDNLSLTNYSLLSRLIDLYFSGYTRMLQKRSYVDYGPYRFDPGRIYTVFAGGDDLLFIGPWDAIILFAGLVYRRFRRFTGNHPEISLSAGIVVGKPSTPLAVMVEHAESALEESKTAGRDRLTVFDTTLPWRDFDNLMAYAQLFELEILKNRADVPGATLNPRTVRRIESYGAMCGDALSGRDPSGTIWIPRFLRQIEKRIAKKDKYGNAENKALLDWLNLLFQRREIMANIRVATQWAMMRNRSAWEE